MGFYSLWTHGPHNPMAVQCKNGDVTFDKTATTATNPDSIPVGTAVPGELPGELTLILQLTLTLTLNLILTLKVTKMYAVQDDTQIKFKIVL